MESNFYQFGTAKELLCYSSTGSCPKSEEIIEKNKDTVHATNKIGMTALHLAITNTFENTKVDLVVLLIRKGANVHT